MTTVFLRGLCRGLNGLMLLGLLGGCGTTEEKPCVLLNCDFEQFEAWSQPIPDIISGEKAHSGHYSLCVKQGADFSGNYHTTLSNCPKPPSALQLEGWTWLPNEPLGSTMLVVEVHCNGRRPDVWVCLRIDQVVRRYQQWEHFIKTIPLPNDLLPSDGVKLYVWCPERGPTKFFDDITLIGLY